MLGCYDRIFPVTSTLDGDQDGSAMIYGGSNDPVYIKKISLRLWTLRDELEAVIEKRLTHMGPDADRKQAIADLLEEYTAKVSSADVLPISDSGAMIGSSGEELDDLGAAMAAAMGGADAAADAPDPFEAAMAEAAGEDVAPAEDPFEAAMATAMEDGGESQESPAEDSSEAAGPNPLMESGTVVEDESSNVVTLFQRRPNLPADKVFNGKTVMAEVGMDEIYFFCQSNLLVGQSVIIEFQIPKRFRLCAEVRYCRQYNMKSRIISENALPFRVVARWTYLRPGERTLLRQFIESIEPVVPDIKPSGQSKPKEDEGDEFDELDDLDL